MKLKIKKTATKMNNFMKMTTAAVMGGLIAVGANQLFDHEKQVVIQEVPSKVHSVALNYGNNAALQEMNLSFSDAAERVTPSVVHIKSTIKSSGFASQRNLQDLPDPFKDFFGDHFFFRNDNGKEIEPEPQIGSGSGVIISEQGYIVTNNHVVKDADEIEVVLDNNRSYEASVIGTDPTTDLALIKIKADDGLNPVPIGNSDDIRVGEWVLAVGNPFNLESTVTAGIISAKGRSINILKENAAIESFIQTDAAVNPGNSGGALVNLKGELIGINTAIASPTGSYSGYSFAVPSNIMKKVVEDLMKYGKVQRAMLGITIRNLDSKFNEEHNIPVSQGVYVDSLVNNGSAKSAGIKKGDVILKVNDLKISSVPELQEQIGRHRPGDEIDVTVLRDGKEKTIHVKLKDAEGGEEIVKVEKSEVVDMLGAEFQELSGKEKKDMDIDHGLKVARLYPGKLKNETSMKEGFIITRINKENVNSVKDLTAKLKDEKGGVLIEGYYPGHKEPVYYGLGM